MGLRELSLFLRRARHDFHHVGALLPSSRALARSMARALPAVGEPLQVLEVGAGTGAFTRRLLERLPPGSRLTVVERDPGFARWIQHEVFPGAEGIETEMVEADILQADLPGEYHAVLSGLPLNNFPAPQVRVFLEKALALVRPGGAVAWFEYVAVRRLKACVAGGKERTRLRRVGRVLDQAFRDHDHHRRLVLGNLPPAWVHELRPRASKEEG